MVNTERKEDLEHDVRVVQADTNLLRQKRTRGASRRVKLFCLPSERPSLDGDDDELRRPGGACGSGGSGAAGPAPPLADALSALASVPVFQSALAAPAARSGAAACAGVTDSNALEGRACKAVVSLTALGGVRAMFNS